MNDASFMSATSVTKRDGFRSQSKGSTTTASGDPRRERPAGDTVDGVTTAGVGDQVGDLVGDSERLRRIDAVTGAALTHLDVPDLLDELLDRVREIFVVDTAAVLLLDEASGELVATAASGIEEEVRQGVRVPVGEGFAGRIAAEVRPVIIDDVDHSDVLNPLLSERGIASLVGVPLVVESRVDRRAPPRLADTTAVPVEDVEFVQMVADRIALAVEARRSNVERAAAAALQRSLIPDRLPAIPGLELAGRYLPAGAGGVGGDWYDVFLLPTGRVGVVIGDVLGRGLRRRGRDGPAPQRPARLRPRHGRAGRGARAARPQAPHFEAGQMTTVLYAVIEPDLEPLSLASAGHPLPLVASAAARSPPSTPPSIRRSASTPACAAGRPSSTCRPVPSSRCSPTAWSSAGASRSPTGSSGCAGRSAPARPISGARRRSTPCSPGPSHPTTWPCS